MSRFADWLISLAKPHPYFDLSRPNGDVYMRRWWLFGHGTDRDRDDRKDHRPMMNPAVGPFQRWVATNLAAVRVHQILLSDSDRDLHDHPAWSVSVILKGGYWEFTPHELGSKWPLEHLERHRWDLCPLEQDMRVGERCIARWRGPGSIVIRRATQRHKLVLPRARECWSMFLIGKKSNEWGFYVAQRKIPWREYESQHGNL